MVLHRVKTGVWMCDQAGGGGNSLQVNPLCRRHPASPLTVGLHSTWTAEMSFAGAALSHIPLILIFWVFMYSCDILLAFGLYSFPVGFCLLCASVVLQSMRLLSSISHMPSIHSSSTDTLLSAPLPFLWVALKFCEDIFCCVIIKGMDTPQLWRWDSWNGWDLQVFVKGVL